jgi:hypothetical protein
MTYNYGTMPKYGGQVCPKCGIPEFTLHFLRLAKLTPKDTFDCPVCGCKLKYSFVEKFPKEQLLLHIVNE